MKAREGGRIFVHNGFAERVSPEAFDLSCRSDSPIVQRPKRHPQQRAPPPGQRRGLSAARVAASAVSRGPASTHRRRRETPALSAIVDPECGVTVATSGELPAVPTCGREQTRTASTTPAGSSDMRLENAITARYPH